MVPQRVNVQLRKDEVLRITINQYIQTVTPVSSARIVEAYPFGVSSATIRNILAELEQDGYLTHPHTSAGRLPTQMGYRYYVDHFLYEIQLLEEEKVRINEEYRRQSLELEALLDKTSQVLSDVTHYTSIVSLDGWNKKLFCGGTSFIVSYPDFHNVEQDILRIKNILAALDEKERLLEIVNRELEDKVDILIGQELACQEIDNCSIVVAQYKSRKGPSGRIAVLGPTRMDYNKVVSAVDYFSQLIEDIL